MFEMKIHSPVLLFTKSIQIIHKMELKYSILIKDRTDLTINLLCFIM